MNADVLRYVSAIEFREDVTRSGPGRITGTILPLGRIAGDRKEVVIPGAVQWPSEGVKLLAEHRGREVMRFVPVERDGELQIDEALPDSELGRFVADEVRSGRRSGLSVEFHALAAAMVQTVREIRSALVTGAAIVKAGAYNQATAEVPRADAPSEGADVALTALGISHGPNVPAVEQRGSGDYTDAILSQYFAGATRFGRASCGDRGRTSGVWDCRTGACRGHD